MKEAQILRALDRTCASLKLVFQISEAAGQLSIVMNRPSTLEPDYETVQGMIRDAIATHLPPDCPGFWLCSRVLGEAAPDWQAYVTLIAPDASAPLGLEPDSDTSRGTVDPDADAASPAEHSDDSAPASRAEASPDSPLDSMVDESVAALPAEEYPEQAQDEEQGGMEQPLSSFCFTRNPALLKSEILPPATAVAQVVSAFHQLPATAQQTLLPHLDAVFRATPNRPHDIEPTRFAGDAQAWFEQLTQLTAAELRKVAIWLSRYCYDPETTVSDLQRVLEPAAAETVPADAEEQDINQPQGFQNQGSRPQPPQMERPRSAAPAPISERQRQIAKAAEAKAQKNKLAAQRQYLALMAGWMILIFAAVIFRARTVDPSASAIAKLCTDSTASPDACALTVQLMGAREPLLELAKEKGEPFPERYQQRGIATCESIGTINAGKSLPQSFESGLDVISSSGEEIFPGIYLAQVEQENFNKGQPDDPSPGADTIRTACVFSYSSQEAAQPMSQLGADVIPPSWPESPYKATSWGAKLQRATLAYGQFIQFGANTLFTAIGLFMAALLGLAIRFQTMNGIILSAFILQIIDTILVILFPFRFGIFTIFYSIARMSVAMLITSGCVKQFEIDWTSGYRIVSLGAFTIMVIRGALHLGLLGLIMWLV